MELGEPYCIWALALSGQLQFQVEILQWVTSFHMIWEPFAFHIALLLEKKVYRLSDHLRVCGDRSTSTFSSHCHSQSRWPWEFLHIISFFRLTFSWGWCSLIGDIEFYVRFIIRISPSSSPNISLESVWGCPNQPFVCADLEAPIFGRWNFNSVLVNISSSMWRPDDRFNLNLSSCVKRLLGGTSSARTLKVMNPVGCGKSVLFSKYKAFNTLNKYLINTKLYL